MESKVWWTRVSRIHTERRLLANKEWLDLLSLWYSLSAVFVSVWLLVCNNNNQHASLTFTCFSIFVLSVSLYGSGSKYSERAAQVKENYVALHQLYLDIKSSGKATKEHNHTYNQLLNSCENHDSSDYIRALIDEKLNSASKDALDRNPKPIHYLKLLKYKIKRFLLLSVLFLLPVILAFYVFS
ncbi:SLATT domain-containing protein [Cobetia sp. cqz5-12]|uniref:SLATT domain-containing protein n=1 Tax=Cobetia sp. cqz5-12 TaxID=2609415 RepID=UPI001908F79E|nr:SLATT domain-containing protein [Cobetia sp. cqz5-12]QQK64906.1 SLATT domain-containing protein [Cobetia sp. cqz5-12]